VLILSQNVDSCLGNQISGGLSTNKVYFPVVKISPQVAIMSIFIKVTLSGQILLTPFSVIFSSASRSSKCPFPSGFTICVTSPS
jgi:hypothetical protein